MAKKSTGDGVEHRRRLREYQKTNKELREDLNSANAELKLVSEMNKYYESNANTLRTMKAIKVDRTKPKKEEQGTVISLLSDIHAESKITLEQTNGFNKFNPGICEQRLEHYFKNFITLVKLTRRGITLDNCVIGLLGDIIHGFIHEEYLRTNYMTPVQASIWITDILVEGFKFILEHGKFRNITVICKIGNHSRTTNKIYSDEEALHSYEWAIYNALAKAIPEIKWMINESYFTYLKVYDKMLRFHHGHAFRYMGGIGGIYIPLMRFIAKVNRQIKADMDFIGHWHTRDALSSGACIMNGSICGANPYSIRLGFPAEEPTQQFQILDSNRGFTINAPIVLE